MVKKRLENFTHSAIGFGTTVDRFSLDVARISDYKYVYSHIDNATGFVYVNLVNVAPSDKTQTYTSTYNIKAATCIRVAVAVLSETKLIVFYITAGNVLYAKIATIGDSDLTFGLESASLYAGDTHYQIKAISLDDSSVIVLGGIDQAGTDSLYVGNFDIVGNTIGTQGVQNVFENTLTDASSNLSLSLCSISSTTFAFLHYDDLAVETYIYKGSYDSGTNTTSLSDVLILHTAASNVTLPEAEIFYQDNNYLAYHTNSSTVAYSGRIDHSSSILTLEDTFSLLGIANFDSSYVASITDQSHFVLGNYGAETSPAGAQSIYIENQTSVGNWFQPTYSNINDSVETWQAGKRVVRLLTLNSGDIAIFYISHGGVGAATYTVACLIADYWSGLSYLENNEFNFADITAQPTDFGYIEIGKTNSNNFLIQNDMIDPVVVNATTPEGFYFNDLNGDSVQSGEIVIQGTEKIIMFENYDYFLADENGNPIRIVE